MIGTPGLPGWAPLAVPRASGLASERWLERAPGQGGSVDDGYGGGPHASPRGWTAGVAPLIDRRVAFQAHLLSSRAAPVGQDAAGSDQAAAWRGLDGPAGARDEDGRSRLAAPPGCRHGHAAYLAQLHARIHFTGPIMPVDLRV